MGFWVAMTRKGIGNPVRLPGDRHLAFLHHLEQGALHLGRSPVDLVGEQEIREDRAEGGRKVSGPLVVDPGAHQVRRNQVRSELDAAEGAAHRLRQRLDREGLRQARDAFHQQMSLGQNRHQDALEEMILADDHFLHLVEDPLHEVRGLGTFRSTVRSFGNS